MTIRNPHADLTVNPWRDARIGDLTRACAHYAGELSEPRRRTPEERAALTQDVFHLLLAMSLRIDTGETMPGMPEQVLATSANPDLFDAFSKWFRRTMRGAVRDVRQEALTRAADLAFGARARRWLNPDGSALDESPIYRCAVSDEAFEQCLRELDALWRDPPAWAREATRER